MKKQEKDWREEFHTKFNPSKYILGEGKELKDFISQNFIYKPDQKMGNSRATHKDRN